MCSSHAARVINRDDGEECGGSGSKDCEHLSTESEVGQGHGGCWSSSVARPQVTGMIAFALISAFGE
jgi:hypothetical protein